MTTALGPGHMLRSYRVEERLGAGAQAVTWRATDTRDGRVVAVKQFALTRAETWKDVELFRRECAVLAGLSHPAIPAFVESFEEATPTGDTELYLVQAYVPAPSIAALMRQGRRWSQTELVETARRLLIIVGWLHMRHPPVVHRDIKPSNVLRDADGHLTLIDFTAVQSRLHSAPEGGSTVVGTHGYMAPEQLLGRAAPSSDIYAVGMTLVHMASGHHPSELPLDGLRVDFRAVVRLDPALNAWLERMTAPDPGARPPSAEVALQELERALTPPAPARTTPRPGGIEPSRVAPIPARRPSGRSSASLVVALVLVVVAALFFVLLGKGDAPSSAVRPAEAIATAAPKVMSRDEQFKDVATEVRAPAGLEVQMRAARIRLGGSSGEPTQIDLAYLLKNTGTAPLGRVSLRAVAHAISTQALTRHDVVSVLQVPLEPGETRRETTRMYDSPRSVDKVVVDLTSEAAPPLPPATPKVVAVAGLDRLPAGAGLELVERRALRVDEGLSGPRMVFDVALALRGADTIFALTLAPTCQTPAGPKPRLNDRDFAVFPETLSVLSLADGELSTFRVICPLDATAVTWSVKGVLRR